MSKSFLQAKYGSVRGVSMASAGCGPTALADIIYNQYKDITPDQVALWLAADGQFSAAGTTRVGISRALSHYDMQYLYATPEHTGGKDWNFFIDLMKNTRDHACWAILLMVGTKNGGLDNYWTSGGHFIAVTDYDPKTDTLYVRDPAGRRDGYKSPAMMKFDCNAMWFITKQYYKK